MNTRQNLYRWIILALLATSLIAVGVLDLTNPKIMHSFIGAGGVSNAGIYSLSSSLGQHAAGEPITGGVYTLESGFWVGGAVSEIKIYLPVVIK